MDLDAESYGAVRILNELSIEINPEDHEAVNELVEIELFTEEILGRIKDRGKTQVTIRGTGKRLTIKQKDLRALIEIMRISLDENPSPEKFWTEERIILGFKLATIDLKVNNYVSLEISKNGRYHKLIRAFGRQKVKIFGEGVTLENVFKKYRILFIPKGDIENPQKLPTRKKAKRKANFETKGSRIAKDLIKLIDYLNKYNITRVEELKTEEHQEMYQEFMHLALPVSRSVCPAGDRPIDLGENKEYIAQCPGHGFLYYFDENASF